MRFNQLNAQVHQAEPCPVSLKQHEVLLLRTTERTWCPLQQNPWQRLEEHHHDARGSNRNITIVFYHFDNSPSQDAKCLG